MKTSSMLLILAASLGLVATRPALVDAGDPPPQNKLTVTGTVLLENGEPAKGAIVEHDGWGFEARVEALTDEQGRFELRAHLGGTSQFHARAADGSQQATRLFPTMVARDALAKPIEFRLAPAQERIVTVISSAGQPVDGAHVLIEGQACRVRAVTDAEGKARLLLPAGDEPRNVVVFHPTLGVAGKSGYERKLSEDDFRLTLIAPEKHTIRILDSHGNPAPELPFSISVTTSSGGGASTQLIEQARLKTNAQGEATVAWFPSHARYVDVAFERGDWKVDETDSDKLAEHLTVVHARHKIAVTGRLIMPAGASAEGILINSLGFGSTNHGDIPSARAAADGSFTLLVAPDHGYALQVADNQWASDGWTGLILAEEKDQPAEISMQVYPAIPIEVRVDRGPERTPVADAWISLRGERQFNWRDAKRQKRSGTAGINAWLRTDATGLARGGVPRGKLHLRLSAGKWNEERDVTMRENSQVSVEFYRPWAAERKISGRLTLGGATFKPSRQAKIEAASDAPHQVPEPLKATLHEDGSFETAGDVNNLTIFVLDTEKRASGFMRIGPDESEIDLPLAATASLSGVLVDHAGHPLANSTLHLQVFDVIQPVAADQITDAQGRFRFDAVVANLKVGLQVERVPNNGSRYQHVDHFYFQPGEVRNEPRLTIDLRSTEERRANPDPVPPLPVRLSRAIRGAGPCGMHILVLLQGDDSDGLEQLSGRVLDYEEQHDVLFYLPLVVDAEGMKTNADALGKLALPLPAAGELVLVAFDVQGNMLGAERLKADPLDDAVKRAAEFRAKHLPPVGDARVRLALARAEAKRTDRKIWLIESGPRCGPCFRLTRWMDEQHELLDKDYIIVKVMEGLDRNAEAVIAELNRPFGGIPWFAILDSGGRTLATSTSASGNIGMPSSVEGIRHLREMLTKTAQHLTADEIDRLAKSLVNFE